MIRILESAEQALKEMYTGRAGLITIKSLTDGKLWLVWGPPNDFGHADEPEQLYLYDTQFSVKHKKTSRWTEEELRLALHSLPRLNEKIQARHNALVP